MIIKINIIGQKIFTGIENRSSIWGSECRSAGLNLGIANDDRRGLMKGVARVYPLP